MGVTRVGEQGLISEGGKGGHWLGGTVFGLRVFWSAGEEVPLLGQLGWGRCSSGCDLLLLPVVTHQTSTSSETPPLSWPVGSATETSGGADLSDSFSSGGVVAQHLPRKVKVNGVLDCLAPGAGSLYWGSGLSKALSLLVGGVVLGGWAATDGREGGLVFIERHPSPQTQSRVRVRRASISEPSDTDPEPRTLDPSPAGKSAPSPTASHAPAQRSLVFWVRGVLFVVERSIVGGLFVVPLSFQSGERRRDWLSAAFPKVLCRER